MKKSLYLTLGCRVVDDNHDFRHAFHALARRYHPDQVGPNGTPFLREIAEAYRVLSDFERRINYDLGLRHAGEVPSGDSGWSPVLTARRFPLPFRSLAQLWIAHE